MSSYDTLGPFRDVAPNFISLEMKHAYRLHRDREFKVTGPSLRSRNLAQDIRFLRKAQLALAERGELGNFVKPDYVAKLLGYKRSYARFCFHRLAKYGYVQRYWRYHKRRSDNTKRYYYWLNVIEGVG